MKTYNKVSKDPEEKDKRFKSKKKQVINKDGRTDTDIEYTE